MKATMKRGPLSTPMMPTTTLSRARRRRLTEPPLHMVQTGKFSAPK